MIRTRTGRRQQGSASVELILVVPLLLLFVAAIIGLGRLTSVRSAVAGTAREAARAAVDAPTAAQARASGQARGAATAAGYGLNPARLTVQVDPGSFQRGGTVRVTVAYQIGLADLPSFGALPGSVTLRAEHVEPIDPYRSR